MLHQAVRRVCYARRGESVMLWQRNAKLPCFALYAAWLQSVPAAASHAHYHQLPCQQCIVAGHEFERCQACIASSNRLQSCADHWVQHKASSKPAVSVSTGAPPTQAQHSLAYPLGWQCWVLGSTGCSIAQRVHRAAHEGGPSAAATRCSSCQLGIGFLLVWSCTMARYLALFCVKCMKASDWAGLAGLGSSNSSCSQHLGCLCMLARSMLRCSMAWPGPPGCPALSASQ